MTLRLLHLADLHLDTAVGGRTPAVRARVRSALRTAFDRAVERALEGDVHTLLVAGDAFDDPLLTRETADHLRAGLSAVAEAGVEVAWCTGNHDPGAKHLGARAGRAALLGLDVGGRHAHPRLHLFRRHRAAAVTLCDRGGAPIGRLVSAGHRTDSDGEDLAEGIAALAATLPADLPRIGMLHTQVDDARGADAHARYAPCTRRRLAEAPLDYWALGHVHVRGPVTGTHAWYSGNPQGRNSKETGARGGLLVEVAPGEPPMVEPIDFSPLSFEDVVLVLPRELDHAAHFAPLVAHELARCVQPGAREVVLRVELRGSCPLVHTLRRPEHRAALEESLTLELGLVDCELAVDTLRAPWDLETRLAAPSALRETLRVVDAAAHDEALALELADTELSPEAPPVGDPRRAAWVARELAAARDELLQRAFPAGIEGEPA